ncbi:hypothetical protein AB1Y20_008774 [Prymnesium parvum]|uniref:Mono(ADP-ribosyl)transferase n=1 Tax=Prymnesium parvum TaxID=97485 RepID=A0AB34IRG0_PRYPA
MVVSSGCLLLTAAAIPGPSVDTSRLGQRAQWPPLEPTAQGVRNVVFSLSRGHAALALFMERSRCLARAMDAMALVDEVVFHTGQLERAQLTHESITKLRLVDVRNYGGFVLPPLDNSSLEQIGRLAPEHLGYRHMCRFMSIIWFTALARYEYAMRVDDDVCVKHFLADPFGLMRQRQLVYGYGLQTGESHVETVETMPAWLASYIAHANLSTASDALSLVSTIFFTNFFVSRVDWWLQPEACTVKRLLDAIDASGGIYRHRWGDAPIQTIALRLLADARRVAWLPMDYYHVSTMDHILADGSHSDGWRDARMLSHPLVREYWRRSLSLSSKANHTLTVTAGLQPTEVAWSLACSDGVHAAGGAPFRAELAISRGANCTLEMSDAADDGWGGAVWSWWEEQHSLATGTLGEATFLVSLNISASPPAPSSSPPQPPAPPSTPPYPPSPPSPPSTPPGYVSSVAHLAEVFADESVAHITIAKGHYVLDATLHLDRNVSISSDGSGAVVLDGSLMAGTRVLQIVLSRGFVVGVRGVHILGGGCAVTGGGVSASKCALHMNECQIYSNVANVGGGLYAFSSATTLVDCSFFMNIALAPNALSEGGGGVAIQQGRLEMSGCHVYNNSALGGGMLVYLFGTLLVTHCTILDNQVKERPKSSAQWGSVATAAGSKECTPCPGGTFTHQAGGIECTACPAGYFCPPAVPEHLGRNQATLSDFVAHESAVQAQLEPAHVVALRFYTTHAFKYMNGPLRSQDFGQGKRPHPLPITMAFLSEAIKKLRAVHATRPEATKELCLWRGMRNLQLAGEFIDELRGGTEVSPMSTTSDIRVAARYGISDCSLLFKVKVNNFIQYGAELGWVSAFPAEAEVCYPPLTYLQPTGAMQVVKVINKQLTVCEVVPHIP